MDGKITQSTIKIGSAAEQLSKLSDNSIQLVVTSPPYPMIEMWDEIMSKQNPEIGKALEGGKGALAFELMHLELDKVWAEVARVLIPGGFVCVNIGDATRTINQEFALYTNHSRIIAAFQKLGLVNLPNILWRKQTNAPNKFMGSGMLPAGAYVTLEHEWILIFRKGGKRTFSSENEKLRRRESSFFWEERNVWFSDLWENIKGISQKTNDNAKRNRSAAYPLEIPFRLINMYSVIGDTVLDPFMGTGTTMEACMIAGRNSIGYEIDESVIDLDEFVVVEQSKAIYEKRITNHEVFVAKRKDSKGNLKYWNIHLQTEVMTSQEVEMCLPKIKTITRTNNILICEYE